MTNRLPDEAPRAPVTQAVRGVLKPHSEVDILIEPALEVSRMQPQASAGLARVQRCRFSFGILHRAYFCLHQVLSVHPQKGASGGIR